MDPADGKDLERDESRQESNDTNSDEPIATEDIQRINNSRNITGGSSNSALVVPRPVTAAPPADGASDVVAPTARGKCVGRNNRGVSWGFTSVVGRRKEMEDAVAVVPGFMSDTCDRIGGCTAPGSRSSGEISPFHFFGVYDGHGGPQVHIIVI